MTRSTILRFRRTGAHRGAVLFLALAACLAAGRPAHAGLCGDSVEVRFAQFPNFVTTQVSCPGVELSCAGQDLGLGGGCRFSIDIEDDTIRIADFQKADYGTGATITVRDLDPLVCDDTTLGTIAGVDVDPVNAHGFVPQATFLDHSVTVTLAKGTTRWEPGDSIELHLDFEGDCPEPEPIARRSGWVPNVGHLADGELPLGDLYTFQCPAGATVNVDVDTKDDLDTSAACLDPVIEIFDSSGTLVAAGDDELACTYAPLCGYACPAVEGLVCGVGGEMSLVVRDFGTAAKGAIHCAKGGGYELRMSAVSPSGAPISADALALGGGPASDLPTWLSPLGLPVHGPVLDDENVPSALAAQGFASRISEGWNRWVNRAARKSGGPGGRE